MSELDRDSVVAVMTTVPDPEAAESIARTVVEERLAACANLSLIHI